MFTEIYLHSFVNQVEIFLLGPPLMILGDLNFRVHICIFCLLLDHNFYGSINGSLIFLLSPGLRRFIL